MAVNLGKNRLALLTAYQDVIDEASDTDWALYTYEGESDDLTLASSGSAGLVEITGAFESSMVMYGFCSMKDASAALPRYVLINWVGEDVPDARKCACASHVATVADFFQGVDIIINASSMEDIDPSAIGQRLTNGTAAVASPVMSRLRTKEEENGVGAIYQKTNAEIEMKKINREEFWEKAKREEELRKEEDRRKAAEERQRFEEERMELERQEQEDRERRYREREREIEDQRKKTQEEEEAKERLRNQPSIPAELSCDDLSQEKKESEVEEAKAIIAQRSENPRDFFKKKERALNTSVDSSPVSAHRTGRLDSPFLRQQYSASAPSPTLSPLRSPTRVSTRPSAVTGDNDAEPSLERNMAAVSPIPKIVTTPFKEEVNKEEESSRNQFAHEQEQEATPPRPVQSVAPQARDPDAAAWGPGAASPVDMWSGGPLSGSAPSRASHPVDLTGDMDGPHPADVPPPAAGRPQPLLSFDDVMEGSFCSGPAAAAEDDPASLVDVTGDDRMTLSYQHALQHAAGEADEAEGEEAETLLTNGETLLKEATQASEGYFSQSQEDEFGQSEESSAKPRPVFYNKPPEIDITCWDTDPVVDDEDDD